MIGGKTKYAGTCRVTVTSTTVVVNNCQLPSNYQATDVHFYVGEVKSPTCNPASFSFNPLTFSSDLSNVSYTFTRSSSNAPVYVSLHFSYQGGP